MELNMRKCARKRVKSVPWARLNRLTTQIEADLVPHLRYTLHGHFALWMRCKFLKMLAFPAKLRLPREQTSACHLGLSL